MRKNTSFMISAIWILVLAFVLSACSSSGSSGKFPTGRFVSQSDENKVYAFNEDNTWAYYLGGLMAAKGTYRIDGDLWIEEGTSECPYSGSYQWSFDGKNLNFNLQGEDNCNPRREATDGQTFVVSK